MNFLYFSSNLYYPTSDDCYSPSEVYPEYQFDHMTVAKSINPVYAAIRQMFLEMELDLSNYGSREWNPLGKWIQPGQKVLIKPNFVMHKNGSNNSEDLDSLVTHPSIIRCVLDYCMIALHGSGEIIIGDAPVKDCDFAQLMKRGNYEKIIDFYERQTVGMSVQFVDFRGPEEEGGQYTQLGKGVLVNLGKMSWFYNNQHDEKKYRIPNYDYKKVVEHHYGETQEYLINSTVLNSDVIISLPKPKTHRKNGYTGALKNFIGINYSKEYLPHHTEGALKNGGDEYKEGGLLRKIISQVRLKIDIDRIRLNQQEIEFNKIQQTNNTKLAKKLMSAQKKHLIFWNVYSKLLSVDRLLMRLRNKPNDIKAQEGAWHGNDTLWRTVLDLNKILLYSTEDGKISNEKQRTVIHLGDMIVSGEKEGPMSPTPKEVKTLLFSDNAVEFDCILTKMMGFDYKRFMGLKKAIDDVSLEACAYDCINLKSNCLAYTGELRNLNFSEFTPFVPAKGWEGYVELKEDENIGANTIR